MEEFDLFLQGSVIKFLYVLRIATAKSVKVEILETRKRRRAWVLENSIEKFLPGLAWCSGTLPIDSLSIVVNHHSILLPRAFDRQQATAHVVKHGLRVALERVPHASAARTVDFRRLV